MWRRLSACWRALLAGAVCLLMLLASHRLAGGAPPPHPPPPPPPPPAPPPRGHHLHPAQSQNWSSNELDLEDSSGSSASVNFTRDIQEVVNDQRLLLSQEMEGYNYPAGQYNLSAKSMKDLVMELGGQPIRNVVVTTWRSGSTFLGDVLNSHPANFYHYEPLLDYGIIQIYEEPLASRAITQLKALLNCNYTNLGHYLNYGRDHIWLFTHNTRLWAQCQQHPHLCWLPEFLSPFCQLFPFQSMKVVRLRLKIIEKLLEDSSLNVRVLLLVRDPRGTLQSRKHRDWCPGNPQCSDPINVCSDLVSDYGAAVHLNAKYPNRFRVVRYEDLSVEPFTGTQDLFKFFGLDFHPSVQQFLDTHTKVDAGGVSSTYRNSKSAPFHWRQDLTHSEVKSIQRACWPAMERWGYLPAANSTHQRDFNPLGPFSLT